MHEQPRLICASRKPPRRLIRSDLLRLYRGDSAVIPVCGINYNQTQVFRASHVNVYGKALIEYLGWVNKRPA
jgi:hypothetical protein